MTIEVLLFAGARATVGCDSIEVSLAPGATCGECRIAIAAQHPLLADLCRSSRLASDDRYLADQEPAPPGAPLALIPPVSGG